MIRKLPLLFLIVLTAISLSGNVYLYLKLNENVKNTKILQEDIVKLTERADEPIVVQETQKVDNTAELERLNRRITCQSLITKTPQTGNMQWMNKNIVEFYKQAATRYDEVKAGDYARKDDKDDNAAELKSVRENYEEAKVLYDQYIAQCSGL